jgi:hypothetical protein
VNPDCFIKIRNGPIVLPQLPISPSTIGERVALAYCGRYHPQDHLAGTDRTAGIVGVPALLER